MSWKPRPRTGSLPSSADGTDLKAGEPLPYGNDLSDLLAAAEAARAAIEQVASPFGNEISGEEMERYDKDRAEYLESYRAYLSNLLAIEQLRKRSASIHLLIRNEGTAPAKDVRIRVFVPDGLLVLEEEDFPSPSDPPKRPGPPRTKGQLFAETLQFAANPTVTSSWLGLPTPDVRPFDLDEAGPSITPDTSTRV